MIRLRVVVVVVVVVVPPNTLKTALSPLIMTSGSQICLSCYSIQHATLGVLTLPQNIVNIDVYGFIKTLDIFNPTLPTKNCYITPRGKIIPRL